MAPRKPVEVPSWLADAEKEVASNSTKSPVQYMKPGELIVKLVPANGVSGKFFETLPGEYNGKPRVDYLISCVILGADDESIADDSQVRFLKVPQTVVNQIIALFKLGWKLTDKLAPGVSITKTGSGLTTTYKATNIPESFDVSEAAWPDMTIEQAVANEIDKANVKAGKPSAVANDETAPF